MSFSLVVQSFGRENEYRRTVLTVMSFYSFYGGAIDDTKVVVFTDRPEWFVKYFNGLPITYVLLTPEKIKAMRGDIDFLHRMKIAVIEEAFQITSDNILYADSDTFFIDDPTPLINQLRPDKSFMHLKEYYFEELRKSTLPAGKTFLAFLALIESKKFKLVNGGDIKITPQHVSWNAGVMMLHPSQAKVLPNVYALTDQFYPASLNHASEQYAFSIMLQEYTKISPCEGVIYHYWYPIKKDIVDELIIKKVTPKWGQLPLHQKINDIKNYSRLLPALFESHIRMKKDNAIQAFNKGEILKGYKWALRAFLENPARSIDLIKDVLYHSKQYIKSRNSIG